MKAQHIAIILIGMSSLFVVGGKLYACDGGGPSCSNCSPVAILTGPPAIVVVDVNVLLDGHLSYDPDGYITQYEWDWTGDDTYEYYETSSYHPDGLFDGKTTHKYADAGDYMVKLRVTDNGGCFDYLSSTTAIAVHVVNLRCNPAKIQPFGDEVTTISYKLPSDANVTLKIHSSISTFATLLNNAHQTAGTHNIVWYGVSGNGDPNDPNNTFATGGRYKAELTNEDTNEIMDSYIEVVE